MKRISILVVISIGLCVSAKAQLAIWGEPPVTPVRMVSDTYFNTRVEDPYRYLENQSDSEVKKWMKTQADFSIEVLSHLPGRAGLQQRLTELSDAGESIGNLSAAGESLFFLKAEPGRNSKRLFVRNSLTGAERILLDPARLAKTGEHEAIDYFSVSPDGKILAVGLSSGGSEDSVLHLLHVDDGSFLDEEISRAGLNDEGIGWSRDSSTFFYNRLPAPDKNGVEERYNKSVVWQHVIGQPVKKDQALIGYGVSAQRQFGLADLPHLQSDPQSDYVIADVQHGDGVDRSFYLAKLSDLKGAATPWRRLITPKDKIHAVALHGNRLYLLSYQNAPRGKILKMDLDAPTVSQAQTVLKPGNQVLREMLVAQDALYLHALDGGSSKLLKLDHQTLQKEEVALPISGSLRLLSAGESGGVLFSLEAWINSKLIYRANPDGKLEDLRVAKQSKVNFKDYAVKEVMYRSHDGVQVPLSILYPRDIKLDGSHPTILTGYGAYGITQSPRFDPMRKAWLEKGGVFAIAHVRGGGEFGEEWHQAAHILNKANSALDLIAAAEYLIAEGYTSKQKLAGVGRSAGGITIGGAFNRRPDLFAAINSGVGVSDLLRFELTANGPPNIAEFGTVKKPDQFKAMLSNSPYHNVRDGLAYPAVIVTTGANDPRVDSWMPAKLAARLQAASTSGKPVLLRVDYDGGHGMGASKSQQVAETTDVWAFFLWQMDVAEFVYQ